MQRRPSHLTSNRYSGELNGASAEAACIGRSSDGKLSSSIWSWFESNASRLAFDGYEAFLRALFASAG